MRQLMMAPKLVLVGIVLGQALALWIVVKAVL